jgi:FixJ family two-component response regulator
MPSLETAVIAVVEDEPTVRRALTRVLTAAKFEVLCYPTGEELLQAIATQRPDCIILDMEMPGMNGREVQNRMMERDICIPIIIVTAHDNPFYRAQCLAQGPAVAYLSKPLPSGHLIACIESALGKNR